MPAIAWPQTMAWDLSCFVVHLQSTTLETEAHSVRIVVFNIVRDSSNERPAVLSVLCDSSNGGAGFSLRRELQLPKQ